jgi:hypothetical protein
MIITDDFVLLNFPKTGTTFTRKILKKVYKDKYEELLLPVISGRISQHGTYAQIPLAHREKTILSIVRNPFDRYVSLYFFRWFAQFPPDSPEILKKYYPNFPEISFSEFLDMVDRFQKTKLLQAYGISTHTDIGFQTIQFMAFYSRFPETALKELIEEKSDCFLKLPKIHFLRQEFLRQDLIDFLSSYHENQTIRKIIASEDDENVSRGPLEKNWRPFWTADLLEAYQKKEELLLNKFLDYR